MLELLDLRTMHMGRFSVTVDLANYEDMKAAKAGILAPDQVRRLSIRGVVDTGAARLVLPQAAADRLGLPIAGAVRVRYANEQREDRPLASDVHLSFAGRSGVFSAVLEPRRDTALIGAIVLEELDLLPDCTRGTLAPRDPERIISEIE